MLEAAWLLIAHTNYAPFAVGLRSEDEDLIVFIAGDGQPTIALDDRIDDAGDRAGMPDNENGWSRS